MEKYGTARLAKVDNILRRMRLECWINNATDTYSEYVILIYFPQQKWLRERASILRLYLHCLCHCFRFKYKLLSSTSMWPCIVLNFL